MSSAASTSIPQPMLIGIRACPCGRLQRHGRRAFSYCSKHVKGIEMRANGGYRLKPDMPEFGSFHEYRSAARAFMTPDSPNGVLQGYRGTDLLRVDPKSGYFGVRTTGGNIRTFFRPDGDPVAYYRSQFS